MYKIIFAFLLSAMWLGSGPAQALEFDGVDLPDTIALPDTSKTVRLNGVGYRKKFFIKVYIGALYTEKLVRSRDDVMALQGPRRIAMHIVHDEISRDKLVEAWNDGFEANLGEEQLNKLRGRIDRFNALFPGVVKGDVIYLDYIPGKGTRVTINNERKGEIPGRDFNDALMDIWLGEEPADRTLKKAMLGD